MHLFVSRSSNTNGSSYAITDESTHALAQGSLFVVPADAANLRTSNPVRLARVRAITTYSVQRKVSISKAYNLIYQEESGLTDLV